MAGLSVRPQHNCCHMCCLILRAVKVPEGLSLRREAKRAGRWVSPCKSAYLSIESIVNLAGAAARCGSSPGESSSPNLREST